MDLLSSTLNAVGQVGEGIDKFTGGRAIRGTLAGKPRELLSVLPFSDTAGLTRHEDATSGRDLTDRYGLTRKGDNGWGAFGAGLLAENVLSPANWLGAGAAFKAAPTVAKGIGQGAKALTGLDLLDHVGAGANKLGKFIGGESGSLRLPFDDAVAPPGKMPRSAPEWVNSKTFYHGTGTPGLTPGDLDPMKTDISGLFGRGIYTTDNPGVAGEYADVRTSHGLQSQATALFSPGSTRKLVRSGQLDPELLRRLLGPEAKDARPEDLLHGAEHYIGQLARDVAGGWRSFKDPAVKEIADLYSSLGGNLSLPERTVYQGQSNFGKILDLNGTLGKRDMRRLVEALIPIGSEADQEASKYLGRPSAYSHEGNIYAYRPQDGPYSGTVEPEGLINAAREANAALGGPAGEDTGDRLIAALKGQGYDALTHTGGTRIGGGKRTHQVVIGLDPNDKLGLGRSTPYSIWEALKDFSGNESGSLNLGAFGARRPSIEAPLARSTMQGAVDRAAEQFTRGFGGVLPRDEAKALATRFFKLPEGNVSNEDANLFNSTLEAGQRAAKEYFSPLYYHINKHLRDLGPEVSPSEIQAIREGRYGDPIEQMGSKLPFNEQVVKDAQFGFDPAAFSWQPDPKALDDFVSEYGTDPYSLKDGVTDSEWKQVMKGHFGSNAQKYIDFYDNIENGGLAGHADDINTTGWDDFLKNGPQIGHSEPDIFSKDFEDSLMLHDAFGPGGIDEAMGLKGQSKSESDLIQALDDAAQHGDQQAYDAIKAQITGVPTTLAFQPDQAKIKSFQEAFGGADPYELMGDVPSKNWHFAMNSHFGSESPQYTKFFEDMAKNDGTWTGLGDAIAPSFQPNQAKIDEFNQAYGPIKGSDDQAGTLKNYLMDSVFGADSSKYKSYMSGAPITGYSSVPPQKQAEVRPVIGGLMGLLEHSRLPEDMNLFRGVDQKGLRTIERILGARLNSPEAVGRSFVDPGFLSTAFDKRTADQFAGLESGYNRPDAGVTFDFGQVPQGKQASFMNATENEVLFPPGRRITINDISNYPTIKATLYGTLLAALMGGQAANLGQDNGYPR